MFHAKLMLVVVLIVTAGAAPVAAQENGTENATATSTPTPVPQDVVPFAGDPTVRITDWSYTDGTFRLILEADVPSLLTATAMPEGTAESGGGHIERVRLTKGRNVVTVPAPSGTLFMTTPTSIDNGRYTYLDASGPPLIGGPFGAGDVRNGILYALLTGAIVLIVLAIRAKLGLDDEAGWVA